MLQRQGLITSLLVVLAVASAPGIASPVAAAGFAGAAPVSNTQLASLRGGFAVGSGRGEVRLAFGIERLSFINGELASVTRLGSATAGGTHLIQNGEGNFVTPRLRSALPSGTLATVIQNSLDGQTISNINVFDITVTSVQAARALSVHNSVLDALTLGLSP